MLLSINILNKIKDNPDLLEKYVMVHNKLEHADEDLFAFYLNYFDSNARTNDYDTEEYDEVLEQRDMADFEYNNFVKKIVGQ